MGVELYPFQQEGVDFLLRAKRAILADDMGLGKTAQALMAARGKTLVIAPAAFEGIWDDAIDTWRGQLDPSLDLWFSSYNTITKRGEGGTTYAAPRSELKVQWDTIIADEAHYLKGRKTKWTQAATRLKSERLYLLTGTPIPNWSHEIFMSLRLLHPGDSRFSRYWDWVIDWFDTWDPPWGGTKINGLRKDRTWEQFYTANGLDGRWMRRLFDDVMAELPPLTQQSMLLDMLTKQKQVYKQVEKEMYAQLESGHEIMAWSQGGIYTKLHKLSTGVEVEDPHTRNSNKLDMLEDLINQRGDRATLVLCRFRRTVEEVARRLGPETLQITGATPLGQRHPLIEQYQGGEGRVLVATIDTVAEGYTLTRADCAIFVERHPRPTKNQQAAGRIRRIGQTKPTQQIDLLSKHSVDIKFSEMLQEKTNDQMAAMRAWDLMAGA